MNRQEIFDKAVSGIIAQGGPSARFEQGVQCCYRTETGRKCAIGQLIADEFYDTEMEGRTAGYEPVQLAIKKSIGECHLSPCTQAFLAGLQNVHDGVLEYNELLNTTDAEFLSLFKEKAYEFAKKWELSPHVLAMD